MIRKLIGHAVQQFENRPAPQKAPAPVIQRQTPQQKPSAVAAWKGSSTMAPQNKPSVSGPQAPQPKAGWSADANQARNDVFQNAYREELGRFPYSQLPPEDQAEVRAIAQRAGEQAVANFDALYAEELRQAQGIHHLPPEDQEALALSRTQSRMNANGGAVLNAEASYVNQRDGHTGGKNNNCGFAAALAALNFLGIQAPTTDPEGVQITQGGNEAYHQTMILRYLGGKGFSAETGSEASHIAAALNTAGANAQVISSSPEWKADHSLPVEMMRQAFLDPSQTEAFIIGGSPAEGYPELSTYDGSHWITVVAYDEATNTFTILDPYPTTTRDNPGPIQVTPEQLATYMADDGIQNNELIHITAP